MPRLPQKAVARCAEMKRAEREGGSALLSRATMRHVAESATDGQFAYVQEALGKEYELGHAPRIAKLRQAAGFPCQKGFDGSEWEGISFPHGFTREDMPSPSFIDRHGGLALHGGPGNGKGHTATALGILACSQGRRVLFASAASLANDPRRASRDGTVQEMLGRLGRCDLMILDEWGCLPTDPDGARLLFRVVSMRCERISLVLTTSIEFSGWGRSSTTTTWPRP